MNKTHCYNYIFLTIKHSYIFLNNRENHYHTSMKGLLSPRSYCLLYYTYLCNH